MAARPKKTTLQDFLPSDQKTPKGQKNAERYQTLNGANKKSETRKIERSGCMLTL